MKIKFILLSAVAIFTMTNAAAQDKDSRLFNHLSVGANIGTTGFGLDVAMPAGNYVQVRAGFAVFPKIKVNTDLDLDIESANGYGGNTTVEIEGKTGFTNGKLLFDIFPFKSSSIHLTVGTYFGASKIVDAYNKEEGALKNVADWNANNPDNKIGVALGDYLLEPDANGNISAQIKTKAFKPYIGLGFGRAVPKKNRIGFMTELGVQFWGAPKVYCNGEELTDDKVGGDAGGVIKTLSKVSVFPVINFRLCGRIL